MVMAKAEQMQDWQDVLWREWRYCHDEAYGQRLAKLVADISVGWETRWRGRPLAMEVEAALRQACQALPQAKAVWTGPLRQLEKTQQHPPSADKLIADLQSRGWLKRFMARHTLAWLGGEAVPQLGLIAADKAHPLQPIVAWLLRSIEVETTNRLFPYTSRMLCPHCLVRCHAHWTDLPGLMSFVYYGCRACGQSRDFLEWTGQIVTVLDASMTDAYLQVDSMLRGNWLRLRSLFDCDWVEIIKATDEQVERFAVQIGNDTDELRQPRYKQMRCLIGVDCHLSKNTIRVLHNQFGQVRRMGE